MAGMPGSPGKGLGVSRQTSCVPAIVAGELAAQVRGGVVVAGEGAQPLCAVCRGPPACSAALRWVRKQGEAGMCRQCAEDPSIIRTMAATAGPIAS